jgi:hypothetical protein
MNANVKKIMIIAVLLCVFFVTFFSVKYFHVSRETSLTIALVILSLVILLQTFVKNPKEHYRNTDEKPRVSKYSSLSRYNV